jgi:uncharacterized membrane protein HdeD (DUF308 family)
MPAGAESKRWSHAWWIPLIVGLVSLLCGLLAVVWPGVTLLALALITGLNLVVLSAFLVGEAIADGEAEDRTLRIVLGVLGVIAGLVVMRRPGETLLVLILALGIWLVLDGLVELVRAAVGATESRLLHAVGGLVDIVLGVLILALPELGLGTLAVLVGLGFLVRGLMLVVAAWQLRGLTRAATGAGGNAPPFTPTPA